MQQPFRDMRREMDELQTQSQNFRNEMAKVRSEHETTVGGYRTATSRLESFEETGSGSPAPSRKPSTGSRGWNSSSAILHGHRDHGADPASARRRQSDDRHDLAEGAAPEQQRDRSIAPPASSST